MDSIADIFGKALALALSLVVLAACPARADIAAETGARPALAESARAFDARIAMQFVR